MTTPAKGQVRVRISLQGGGVLEGVNEIVRVVVEPEEIHCERVDDGHVLISGAVQAFLYFKKAGHQDVQGEGVKIPFSRRIDTPGIGDGAIELELQEAESNYDYNPVTGSFQHRITLLMDLAVQSQPFGIHQGETRLSQIRVGPGPEDQANDADPKLTQVSQEQVIGSEPLGKTEEKEPLVWKPFPPPIQ